MKRTGLVAFVVVALLAQSPVRAQGIPVIDAANLEQALQNIAA